MGKVVAKKKSGLSTKTKRIILIALSAVIGLSIVCSAFFGFKLYAYGRDVTIIYDASGGKLDSPTQVVEVGKAYTLKTPVASGKVFLYWSTDGTEKGKVKTSGRWFVSAEKQIVLRAVWQVSAPNGEQWTGNY